MRCTEICEKYCIGCGLCHSELHTQMQRNHKGYYKPLLKQEGNTEDFLRAVCPVTGYQTGYLDPNSMWGKYTGLYAGYAKNSHIRQRASSGGMLTALAMFLLESGTVDAIIQVRQKKDAPTETECCICQSKEEVESCCGSRYAISSPWMELSNQVQQDKKYAAIGKPCDIAALRNMKNNWGKYENILYLLSFFCAGLPSADANARLLSALGCEKNDCASLTYRGNGWPGKATAIDGSGKKYQMEYAQAWGGILGRDVHPYCRLCIDGIGEAADISCGDGWYVSPDGKVDFSEREGRNIVFARTEKGEALLKMAQKSGAIVTEPWENPKDLEIIQNYQFTRRATMRAKILAHRLFLQSTPHYSRQVMKSYGSYTNCKKKFRIFAGTAKRILKRKL